jgi:hypothetical protein
MTVKWYVSFLLLQQNSHDNKLNRKKGLFCLVFSEVLFHGHFALLLLGYRKVEHHGGK